MAVLSAGLVRYRNRRGRAADDVDRRAGRPVAVLIGMTVPGPVTAWTVFPWLSWLGRWPAGQGSRRDVLPLGDEVGMVIV